MKSLFVFIGNQLLKSRLLWSYLIFAVLVNWAGFSVLHGLTVKLNGALIGVGAHQQIGAALFFELFACSFFAISYGLWFMPYAHQGRRALVSYGFPVPKVGFPLLHAIFLFLLLWIPFVLLVGFVGWGSLSEHPKLFSGALLWFVLQNLALVTLAVALSASVLTVGVFPSMVMGLVIFIATLVHTAIGRVVEDEVSQGSLFLNALPQFGGFVFQLRDAFVRQEVSVGSWLNWVIWFLLFALAFWFKISFPQAKSFSSAK